MDESDSDLIHCQRTYWIHPTDIGACIVSVQKLLLKKKIVQNVVTKIVRPSFHFS